MSGTSSPWARTPGEPGSNWIERLGGPPGRVTGIDLARFLALAGMMLVHVRPVFGATGAITVEGLIASGRASALFAVLAGVSIALISGGSDPSRRRPHLALSLAIRSALLVALGMALGSLDPMVYVILVHYGLLFVLAIPFLRLRARALFVLAGLWAVAGPVLSFLLRPHLPGWDRGQPTFASLGDPVQLLSDLAFTGVYPVVPWMAFLFGGMAIGRLDLRRRATAVWLGVAGLVAVVAAWVASWLLLGPLGGAAELGYQGTGWPAVWQLLTEELTGNVPTGSWWELARLGSHTTTPTDMVHMLGSAAVVIAVSLLAAQAVSLRPVVVPMAAAGSMTLTLYTLHVLTVQPGTLALWLVYVVIAVALGCAWKWNHRRGPLEGLVALLAVQLPARALSRRGG